jgi:hypothetical protein
MLRVRCRRREKDVTVENKELGNFHRAAGWRHGINKHFATFESGLRLSRTIH